MNTSFFCWSKADGVKRRFRWLKTFAAVDSGER